MNWRKNNWRKIKAKFFIDKHYDFIIENMHVDFNDEIKRFAKHVVLPDLRYSKTTGYFEIWKSLLYIFKNMNCSVINRGTMELWYNDEPIRSYQFSNKAQRRNKFKEWIDGIVEKKPDKKYLFFIQIIPEN